MAGACILSILGVLLPPVAVFIERGCAADFWINLILTIFLVWFGGIIHAFYVFGVALCTNILCLFLPPVGVFLEYGCTAEFWISLILTILGYLPGIIYSYFAVLKRIKGV